jgi:hypothetical protein
VYSFRCHRGGDKQKKGGVTMAANKVVRSRNKKSLTKNGATILSKKDQDRFVRDMQKALIEKDVENVYKSALKLCIPDSDINSRFSSIDGELSSRKNDLLALLEFKHKLDLKKRVNMAQVLVQTIYYLKRYVDIGHKIPKVVFVGDEKNCFVTMSSFLQKYFTFPKVDWNIAASVAYQKNIDMIQAIIDDEDIKPFVFSTEKHEFSDVVDKLLDFNKNGPVMLVEIDDKNITNIFKHFVENVIIGKMNTNEKVALFVNILTNPDEHYCHPNKKNLLVTPNGNVKIDKDSFLSFFAHFDGNPSPEKCKKVRQCCDRLLENAKRRMDGAYFTPCLWVDEAVKMLDFHVGSKWKDEYVVWDCAAGTGNLTADYNFKNLYVSTINKEEMDIQLQNKVNENAIDIFQYDFLSEEGIDNVPTSLKKCFEDGKKVMFFINPPYGTAKNGNAKKGNNKKGIAKTELNKVMLKDGMGSSSQQLYAQFLYKIYLLNKKYKNNIAIGFFSPPLFLTGEHFLEFRKSFLASFDYKYGMLFQASEFADVKQQWGIGFTIWKSV